LTQPDPSVDRLPRLVAIDGPLRGHVFELDGGYWSVGRGAGNRVTIEDPSLSRQHCAIERSDDELIFRGEPVLGQTQELVFFVHDVELDPVVKLDAKGAHFVQPAGTRRL
jgi:hypothetical protein